MKQMNTKGQRTETSILWILLALIAVGAFAYFFFSSGDDIDVQWDNTIAQTCQGTDGEGIVFTQLQEKGCPCDIDDPSSDLYTGKLFTVSTNDSTMAAVKSIFNTQLTNTITEEKPLKISQVNLDHILDYIQARTGESPNMNAKLELEYPLVQYLISDSPDIRYFCYSITNQAQVTQFCQKRVFYQDWLVGGETAQGECKTPQEQCMNDVEEACRG